MSFGAGRLVGRGRARGFSAAEARGQARPMEMEIIARAVTEGRARGRRATEDGWLVILVVPFSLGLPLWLLPSSSITPHRLIRAVSLMASVPRGTRAANLLIHRALRAFPRDAKTVAGPADGRQAEAPAPPMDRPGGLSY